MWSNRKRNRIVRGWIGLVELLEVRRFLSASVSYTGGTYTQLFDTLVSSGTGLDATSGGPNDLSVAPYSTTGMDGWSFFSTGTNAGQFAVGSGTAAGGKQYSFGAAGSGERALGQVQSGTNIPTIGVK